MEPSYAERIRILEWVHEGLTDEQIAQALLLSVKQVRPIRLTAEAAIRPR
ncbi:MAG: hypothetical protein WD800_05980 [Dehalococcoidia bacterium]